MLYRYSQNGKQYKLLSYAACHLPLVPWCWVSICLACEENEVDFMFTLANGYQLVNLVL